MANKYLKIDLTEEQKQYVRDNASTQNMNQLAANIGVPKFRVDKFCRAEKIEVKFQYNKVKAERNDGFFDYDRMYL